jgi:Xaa-Pro aminopeptidase
MTHNPRAIDAIRQNLTADALLVTSPVNVSYLTGFGGDSSFLAVSAADAVVVSDERFRLDLRADCPGLAARIRGPHRDTWQETADLIAGRGWRRVAVEAGAMTVAQFDRLQALSPGVEWVKTFGLVEGLRAIKTAEEVEATREAVRGRRAGLPRADADAAAGRQRARRGRPSRGDHAPERGGRSGVPDDRRLRGALGPAPRPAVGLRAAGRVEFLLVDWGAEKGGYRSDQTRVVLSPFRRRGGPVELRLRGL